MPNLPCKIQVNYSPYKGPVSSVFPPAAPVLNYKPRHGLVIDSLRKSRTSRTRLLCIAQNCRVFAGVSPCLGEFNAFSWLSKSVLHSSEWVSSQCTAGRSGFSSQHFSSTQTSHTFHALHAAVGAAMIFFHPPVLVSRPGCPSADPVSHQVHI
jgi:hypothetical protein